jgi:hypothetical protein
MASKMLRRARFGPAIRRRIPIMTIGRYNPLKAPDPEQWLALDEDERIRLALEYHARARIEAPNANAHATLHVIVENQIALGDETPVRLKASQLMAQGLDRHDAIHAIASVLMKHLGDVMNNPEPAADANQHYYAALRRLNARSWLRSG